MASSRFTGLNENISTFGTLAAGRDYDVMTDWEAFTDNDLVTATTTEVLECYRDSATFTSSATFSGATTNVDYKRIIRPAVAHRGDGIPGNGVHFVNTASTAIFTIAESFFSLQDVSVTFTANSASLCSAVLISSGTNANVVGCLVKCTNAGAGNGIGIRVFSANNGAAIINCLVYECKSYGIFVDSTGTKFVLGNTAYGNGIGIRRHAGTSTAKNNLSTANTTNDFEGTWGTAATNASEDATAPGTGARTSQTFTFVDSGGRDFHLSYLDTGALGFGTDLTGEANFPFDDDIDFATIVDWSIGFDSDAQPPASGGGVAAWLRRRRRMHRG